MMNVIFKFEVLKSILKLIFNAKRLKEILRNINKGCGENFKVQFYLFPLSTDPILKKIN
ncbi:MAG: hypothetical protein CM15mP65_10010 [Crocinitomicaceae bacterium]|nr:MAG: hypothetical protein CM15mP65_10010 [Crocinitomicaceae bacterium]